LLNKAALINEIVTAFLQLIIFRRLKEDKPKAISFDSYF